MPPATTIISTESSSKKRKDDQQKSNSSHNNEFKRLVPPRRPFTNWYQNLFLGYCFSCNNFGHKEIDCKSYARNDHVRDINRSSYKIVKGDYVSNKTRNSHEFVERNYNSFSPLLDYNVECYKCNKYGHIGHDYRSGVIKKEEDVLAKH